MYFQDRSEAGRKLAGALEKYRGKEAIVCPLPRGGVALGVEIARLLALPIDIVISKKIGHPLNAEYAIAAVSSHGFVAQNPLEVAYVDPVWFQHQVDAQKAEAVKRYDLYMKDRTKHRLKGKEVILIDDGIATGLTMEAVIQDVRGQSPSRVVVAVPVAPAQTVRQLESMVDDVVVLDAPEQYMGAVGAYYYRFPQLDDNEVIRLLDQVSPRTIAHAPALQT